MKTAEEMLAEAMGDKVGEMQTHLTDGLTRSLAWALAFWKVALEHPAGSTTRKSYVEQSQAWTTEAEGYQRMLDIMGVKT